MELLQTILIIVFTLAILVGFHEYGHFWVARRCGVKVIRFSIGFGKPLWRWHDSLGTEYVIALIPLGGYVKMLDEREGEVADEELDRAFNRKSVLQRIAVVAAGPLANFLLAIAAFWLVFALGVNGLSPLIDQVAEGSVAEQAGLQPGHEIVAVDGVETQTRQQVSMQLLRRLGETGTIRFAVKQQDSNVVIETSAKLQDWLVGEEAPDLVGGIGVTFYRPPLEARVGEVVADSPAEEAGLQVGDLIISADGVAMSGWSDWVDYVRARPETTIELQVQREGELVFTDIVPLKKVAEDGSAYGQVGVAVEFPEWPEEMVREFRYSLLGAAMPAVERTWEITSFTLVSIKKMLSGLISPKNLSGPITIAKVAASSAKSGLESYVGFLALLSISLGVLNLLPIPVLDGGHLLYYLIEMVKGSPVSERAQALGYQVGLFVLIGVMLLAFYNDIARL